MEKLKIVKQVKNVHSYNLSISHRFNHLTTLYTTEAGAAMSMIDNLMIYNKITKCIDMKL
jgi:hypothetical protein